MNIQEQLNSLIRGNPLSVDTYLREVCKNEHISDTKASMHIYMLKLDGNNRPRTCDFCDYLINRIVDYCIPPSEIRKAKEKDAEYMSSARQKLKKDSNLLKSKKPNSYEIILAVRNGKTFLKPLRYLRALHTYRSPNNCLCKCSQALDI